MGAARALGWGGAGAFVAGAVAASVAQRRAPWDGYLSALGVGGQPLAWAFRLGQAAAALACVAIGSGALPGARGRRPALVAAGLALLVATAVTCSPGCPLPLLDERVPGRDWVHVAAALSAFDLWVVASRGRWQVALALHLAALGPLTLVAPHGGLGAVLQRTLALTACGALAAGGLAEQAATPAGHPLGRRPRRATVHPPLR